MVVAMRNVPNYLQEQVNWNSLDDMSEKLTSLMTKPENYEVLNQLDAKAKKLNQRYNSLAVKQVRAMFDRAIIGCSMLDVAESTSGAATNNDTDEGRPRQLSMEELKTPEANMTCQSINKIIQDFHDSLVEALGQLGAYSNVEKHMNELIHRANFRFSDLHTWLKDSEAELRKCNGLRDLIHETINEREAE